MTTFFTDGYADPPRTPRAVLEERIRQLKTQSWADPGDADLREMVAQAEAELRAFDARGDAR